jgi:ubiquinone/menaquinone biosynthesis C-methylase UbiE
MLEQARASEVAKYVNAYRSSTYRMGDARRYHAELALSALPKGSLLDVGCGRGETMRMAADMGFSPVRGLEVVPYLCVPGVDQGFAHAIPHSDGSFDVVTMFDVMEHLLPEDTETVCRELERVAKRYVLLTVHNGSSQHNGVELHINRRASYDAWYEFFKRTFSGSVTWMPRCGSISEMFKVSYGSR